MHSAIMRYLRITLQSRLLVRHEQEGRATFIANVPVEDLSRHRDLVASATAWIVERIARENPTREIVFLMDAPRADLYAGSLESSSVGWLTEVLAGACAAQGVRFVDMTRPFARAHARDGTRFEWPVDLHWNAAGHREAGLALARVLVERGVVAAEAARALDTSSAARP
jgi:hypothetical protein